MNRKKLESLGQEFRPSMEREVLFDWALDVVAAIGFTPTMRHKKRGSDYEVEMNGVTLQTDEPLEDGANVTFYVDADGRGWVRRHEEITDGRFEPITR